MDHYVDGKKLTREEMRDGLIKHIEEGPERYKKYLAVDCSEPVLRKLVDNKFSGNTDWNREWQIYDFLKSHCGISQTWFEPQEYERRMDIICRIAGV